MGRLRKLGRSRQSDECSRARVTHSFRITALEQLQELTCAPSVGMHDVPRQSVREHLGFGKDEEEGRDELDERLARKHSLSSSFIPPNHHLSETEHVRYIYNLQESDTPEISDDQDSSRWDSDESTSSRRHATHRYVRKASKKRMSILAGQYFDVPTHEHGFSHYECGAAPGKTGKRRFFQSAVRWDEAYERVLLGRDGVFAAPRSFGVGDAGERGGGDEGGDDVDDGWDDMES